MTFWVHLNTRCAGDGARGFTSGPWLLLVTPKAISLCNQCTQLLSLSKFLSVRAGCWRSANVLRLTRVVGCDGL